MWKNCPTYNKVGGAAKIVVDSLANTECEVLPLEQFF
jgi:hypothetical protein